MADARPLPPPLVFRSPDCPICDQETNAQPDSFDCEQCRCSWPKDSDCYTTGEWNDPGATQCAETVQPYLDNSWVKDDDARKHESYRCVRDADHVDSDWHEVKQHAHPEMSVCVKGWV
jgi:hypothetical protein